MKVKVVKKFKDKHTRKIHKVNDVLEVSQERYKEILEKGELVEPVGEMEETEGISDTIKPTKKKNDKK